MNAHFSLDRATVTQNTGVSGVGVYVQFDSSATITRSTIAENAVADSCNDARGGLGSAQADTFFGEGRGIFLYSTFRNDASIWPPQ